jgi:signal transduction histidine kinase
MTERDRLEREIKDQAAELASSRERAHLAQELHDSVTQALFSITLTAGAARMLLERNGSGVEAKLEELGALSREALAEMRSLIFELRPGSLSEEGFVPALRKHVAAVQGRTGLVIRLDVSPDLASLPLPVEDALYRIAQEAIHNVVKHARAHEVGIRIAMQSTTVRMQIRDDGIGFDQRSRRDGIGMAGMALRAERVGGSVTVESAPGRGMVVTATLPARDAQAAPGRAITSARGGSPRRPDDA